MEVKIILDNSKKMVQIVCPHCGTNHENAPKRFKTYVGKKIRAKCKECGQKITLAVQEKKRSYARKAIDGESLTGYIYGNRVEIKDLSRTGVRFSYHNNRSPRHRVNDRIVMMIMFPKKEIGEVRYELIVRSVGSNEYGCEFTNANTGSQAARAVGFYLFELAQKGK